MMDKWYHNKWYHIVFIKQGEKQGWYINGKAVARPDWIGVSSESLGDIKGIWIKLKEE